jgi:hypothetical protein
MEAKFGPLEKKIKATDINRDEFFSEGQPDTPFLPIKRMMKFWKS